MKRLALVTTLVFAACSGTNPINADGGTGGGITGGGVAGGGTGGGSTGGGAGGGNVDAGSDGGMTTDAGTSDGGYVKDPLITARPFNEVVPVSYVPGTPTPLVIELHGYTATGMTEDAYLRFSQAAQSRGFLLALPDGTIDGQGQHFWNATDACCGFGQSTVDDVAYVTAVIEDMKKRFTIDPKRIFLVGHSNGGFMAHRMACDRSELIAGIVSLAGAVWSDASMCQPTAKINVLQVHGTLDGVIYYAGGSAVVGAPPFPGAETTVATWAQKNACTGSMLTAIGGDLDLEGAIIGAETSRLQFTGCPAGAAAELWKMNGASHVPAFNTTWADTVFTWMMAHPKP
ncbi:MAG: prolyl oligopeptidase family serine peptidase [Archangium sp.]